MSKEKHTMNAKLRADHRRIHALKAKMGKYKKGSKQHNAALRAMKKLKRKMASKVRAAKRKGMAKMKSKMRGKLNRAKKKGMSKEKHTMNAKLRADHRRIHALKAKMGKYKKG